MVQNFKYLWFILLLFLVAAAGIAEDVIITKNQRLHGKVKSASAKGINIDTPEQGVVFVPHAEVVQVTAAPGAPSRPTGDIIVTKNQRLQGKVKSADSKGVAIEIAGQGILTVPRSAIIQLTVEPPPSIIRGIEAYEKGNYREAQLTLAKVVNQYLGLDTDWAAKAFVYYGRGCLAAGDTANAEKAFSAFLTAYDDDQPLRMNAELGLAETAVARNDIDKAMPKFQELAAEYEKQLKPSKEQLPYAAAVFLNLGKCLETKNDPHGALDSYLKVIALYPADNVMPEALYRAALIYQRQNKLEKANLVLNDLITQYAASPYAKKAADLKKEMRLETGN